MIFGGIYYMFYYIIEICMYYEVMGTSLQA